MQRAREMAAGIGVDRLCWELTDHPEDLYSRRFVPGRRTWRAFATRSGTTTTWGTPSRALRRARRLRCGPIPLAGLPIVARHGRPLTLRARSGTPLRGLPGAGDLRAPAGQARAQLCGPDGSLVNRDYERAWLPRALGPGDRADVRMKITAPSQPGRIC